VPAAPTDPKRPAVSEVPHTPRARYQGARFLASAGDVRNAPPDQGYEVAFAGRSNAGKSSAINALCQQKSLARTGKLPGRTRLLNFFSLDEERRLVDLPGYGFAKVAVETKVAWQDLMESYLHQRRSLRGLVLVVDCRRGLADFDRQMLAWVGAHRLPAHILLTKADKLKRGARAQVLRQVGGEISRLTPPVGVQLFSALERQGLLEEAYRVLDRWLGVSE